MDDDIIDDTEIVIAFTGHRPPRIGGYNVPNPIYTEIRAAINMILETYKRTCPTLRVITGMAQGVDQWAAELCIELDIPFTAAIPFKGQENMWPESSKREYHRLLEKADKVVIVSEGDFSAEKMQIRNEWMVNNCTLLVAVYDGSAGGTSRAVKYAEKVGREVKRISPHWSVES
jgi:uncharacterized phage-like protein YoqJ